MYTRPDRAEDGMDSILDVKEALVARSRTTSLDDLKSQGRRQVKVIRAEHIAAMVQEAVQKVLRGSDMVSREEVDHLVERSQEEFRHIIQEREEQLNQAREASVQLEEVRKERVRLQSVVQDLMGERDQLSGDLEVAQARAELLASQLAEARASVPETPPAPAPAPAGDSGPNVELMMRLMNEVAELKASMNAPAGPSAAPEAARDPGINQAIDRLAGTLNERLEKFGRKIGISSAVEGQQANFEGLFEKGGGGGPRIQHGFRSGQEEGRGQHPRESGASQKTEGGRLIEPINRSWTDQ